MAISNKFGSMVRDHRQQVGDVGRLRHALRRHERRLQSGQGPLQDRGLRSRPLAERAQAEGRARARPAGSSRRTSSPARRRPSFARTRPTRIRCRPTTCSTTSSNAWSRARCASPRSSPAATTEATVREGRAAALPRRIQAPAGGARREDHAEEFRPRPPLPDHQQVPRSGVGRSFDDSSHADTMLAGGRFRFARHAARCNGRRNRMPRWPPSPAG